jgi:hypothetical protein
MPWMQGRITLLLTVSLAPLFLWHGTPTAKAKAEEVGGSTPLITAEVLKDKIKEVESSADLDEATNFMLNEWLYRLYFTMTPGRHLYL